ncbi:MAG TPA: hypothetical protein VK427_21600, partial [Kofleriaceae bacterium]|nr:hypothetical protein [Kofleriaceae bacterium]
LLVEGPPQGTRIVNLTGPADLTLDDVAAALATVAGKPIHAVAVPPSAMVGSLVGLGASRETAEMYGEMTEGLGNGAIVWDGGELVRGQITIEQRLGELLASPERAG